MVHRVTTKYLPLRNEREREAALRADVDQSMNLYRIEQLKAEALARCKKRMEMREKTDVVVPAGLAVTGMLRKKHGL